MKITVIDSINLFPEHTRELRRLGRFTNYDANAKNKDETVGRVKGSEIIINFWYPMPASIFNKLPKLKMVVVAAAGYDWIDIDAARNHGVIVSNCPGHNTESVAEHTWGLILAANRKIVSAQKSVDNGEWKPAGFKGVDLKTKTLGIVGYGRIGKRVADIATKAFQMKVLYINSKSSRKDFKVLLKTSDVISINTPLTDKTKGMISDKEFDLMKRNVLLVNTGRGAVIDQTALLKNLKNKKIGGVGLDGYPMEPPKTRPKILDFDNVVFTPHIAWDTKETDYYLSKMVVENIRAFIRKKPINMVTK